MEPKSSQASQAPEPAPAGLEAPIGTEQRCIQDVGCQTDDRFLEADEPVWDLPEPTDEGPARKKIKKLKKPLDPDPLGLSRPKKIKKLKKPLDPDPLGLSRPKSVGQSAADVKRQMALATALIMSAGAYLLKSIEKKEQDTMDCVRTQPSVSVLQVAAPRISIARVNPTPLSLSSLTGVTALVHPTSESMAMAEATRSVETLPLPSSSSSSEEEKQEQGWILDSVASYVPPPPTTTRPLPPRCSPFPKGASVEKIRKWNMKCRETSKLAAKDPRYNLPFLKQAKDTGHAVTSLTDKAVVHKVASCVVSISSIQQDDMVIRQCTGIILDELNENGHTTILTSSAAVCDYDGKLLNCKLLIYLPNKVVLEGNILFYDPFYTIALLDVSAGVPLEGLSFAASPEYGDEVFVLARNRKSLLTANKNTVSCTEEPYSDRNFFMYLSYDLPQCGTGGPIVAKDGYLSGIALKLPAKFSNAILPGPIIVKCIDMQRKFRRIARPVHGLTLRTVKLLGVTAKDRIISDHNINSGYIVDEVLIHSTAEAYDVRLGDVIVSFDGMCSHSLLELELHFLSLGWHFLEMNMDLESKVVLKLLVRDPLGDSERSIRLPVGFTCFSPTGTASNGEDVGLAQDARSEPGERAVQGREGDDRRDKKRKA